MKTGTRVKRDDGKLGMVVDNFMGSCDADEIPVVYDGSTYFDGTNEGRLTDLGIPDHKPDVKKCGGGTDQCCIFLTCEADGFKCARFSYLRNQLIFRTMNAKRHPPEPYPDCMNVKEKGDNL